MAEADAGRLEQYTLIEAALIASGADNPEELDRYRRKYEIWREAAKAACLSGDSPRHRAEALFEFMHREILPGGYDSGATELTGLLDTGRFNCASATVLFNALAADCGLDARAIELPRHAFSEIISAGDPLPIETTCPTWFHASESTGRTARHVTSATDLSAAAATGREVSPTALVGVIYYNRGIDFLDREQFPAAVSANLRALRFDPANAAAEGNLLAAINNWALARSAAGEYRAAAELLAKGRQIAPDHEPFANNQRHVYRLWIESLAAAGRRAEAAGVLAAAKQAQPASLLWTLCAKRFGL